MAIHDRNELDREDSLVRANTRASLMSDTKWRKLFSAMESADLAITQCIFKFINVADEKLDGFPPGLHPPKPWFDDVRFGPTPFRSIEWVLFPRVAREEGTPTRHRLQDVDRAADLLAKIGKFPCELSERGLLVRGYLPRSHSADTVRPFVDNIR